MDSYRIAAIDVHKSMLAVVVTDAAVEGELLFERRKFGALGTDLKALAEWLAAQQVQEVVMESTAQYWKPVWRQLEGSASYIWHRRTLTVPAGGGRMTSATPSGWRGDTCREN
jgi:hypothetical protein